ncbi:Ethanolamine utilization protein EutG [Serratia marcescens]|uniref:Ethanolamine utilization protein EutG n=1 Tax=Serratia marcescens TaxID=615 RepID=A0A379Y1V1_SERMA|nr:Ethanolamine utilization protein EutG [Serratia marcescens]
MSVSHIIANRQTWFGHGSIQQLSPLLLADPQPTLLFSCRSFLNGPVYAGLARIAGAAVHRHRDRQPRGVAAGNRRLGGALARTGAARGGHRRRQRAGRRQGVLRRWWSIRCRRCAIWKRWATSKISAPPCRLIAIPTTAGTGSEVTQNAVITDTPDQQGEKLRCAITTSCRTTAILDPQLLAGAPDKVLAYCAIDAFTHPVRGLSVENRRRHDARHVAERHPPLPRRLAGAQPQRRGARGDHAGFLPRRADAERRRAGGHSRHRRRDRRTARLPPRAGLRPPAPAVPRPCWKTANSRSNAR